jgi:hypothetical protein
LSKRADAADCAAVEETKDDDDDDDNVLATDTSTNGT